MGGSGRDMEGGRVRERVCVCVCVCARENEGECEMGKQDRYRALEAESGSVCKCVSDRKQLIMTYHGNP